MLSRRALLSSAALAAPLLLHVPGCRRQPGPTFARDNISILFRTDIRTEQELLKYLAKPVPGESSRLAIAAEMRTIAVDEIGQAVREAAGAQHRQVQFLGRTFDLRQEDVSAVMNGLLKKVGAAERAHLHLALSNYPNRTGSVSGAFGPGDEGDKIIVFSHGSDLADKGQSAAYTDPVLKNIVIFKGICADRLKWRFQAASRLPRNNLANIAFRSLGIESQADYAREESRIVTALIANTEDHERYHQLHPMITFRRYTVGTDEILADLAIPHGITKKPNAPHEFWISVLISYPYHRLNAGPELVRRFGTMLTALGSENGKLRLDLESLSAAASKYSRRVRQNTDEFIQGAQSILKEHLSADFEATKERIAEALYREMPLLKGTTHLDSLMWSRIYEFVAAQDPAAQQKIDKLHRESQGKEDDIFLNDPLFAGELAGRTRSFPEIFSHKLKSLGLEVI